MTEMEKKRLLTKEEYVILMSRFGYEKPVVKQVNYYYDTVDLSMNRQDITCRIRLKDGKYKGTIKSHSPDGCQSTESEIKVYDGIRKNEFTEIGLKHYGELITKRCIIFKDEGCEAVLDKNEYLGCVDFELEIEYKPDFEHHAADVLRMLTDGIKSSKTIATDNLINSNLSARSKSKRFFERYLIIERRKKC